jgi:putative lipoprotein
MARSGSRGFALYTFENRRERRMSGTMWKLCATLLVGGLCACATGSEEDTPASYVTGTVTYLQRVALPPDAELRVELQDVTVPNAPGRTIASGSIVTGGAQVPIPFSVAYDPGQINETRTYSVHAEILVGGERRFISTQVYPVITRDAPRAVDIVVMALERTPVATALVGTYWKLVSVAGKNVIPVQDARREPHLTLLPEQHRAIATGGCNQMTGTYQMTETTLQFSAFAATRMACPDVMDQEGALGQALAATRGYRITDTTLELVDAKSITRARFEAALHEE